MAVAEKRTNGALVGGGLLTVLCCAVGLAVIGALAGSAIRGWLGIACAVVVGLLLRRRGRARGAVLR